jgi:hypothetical protein
VSVTCLIVQLEDVKNQRATLKAKIKCHLTINQWYDTNYMFLNWFSFQHTNNRSLSKLAFVSVVLSMEADIKDFMTKLIETGLSVDRMTA